MRTTLRNFLTTLKRFKTASVLNVFGLSIAFTVFLVMMVYVNFEYGYDQFHENKTRIFQVENMRDDQIWESNFSRPHLEAIIQSSPHIVAGGVHMGAATPQFNIAFSASADPNVEGFREKFDRMTPGFTEVFDFQMVDGDVSSMEEPDKVLIPESIARKFYGHESAVGKPFYVIEVRGTGEPLQLFGTAINELQTVGGVYRDFPENSRLQNLVYLSIPQQEMMHDWSTGPYYGYVLLDDPAAADEVAAAFVESHADVLESIKVENIRLRPLTELYFGEKVRHDGSPYGNKLVTNMLLLIAFLVVIIASINFINFSIALTPVRIKSINTKKVLGQSTASLRFQLVFEAVLTTGFAFVVAMLFAWLLQETALLNGLLGLTFSLSSSLPLLGLTAVVALGVGLVAGLYPAWHMTSFPAAMVLSGSFAVSGRAKFVRKSLIGFQYIVSIILIVCALFVQVQHTYIGKFSPGFDKENVLEVKLSMGIAATKSDLYRQMLLQHPEIKSVGFTDDAFVHDGSRSFIAYNYNGERHYQNWLCASPDLPETMGLQIVQGRGFRPEDGQRTGGGYVCIINEATAKDIEAVVGEQLYDGNTPVEIIGIYKDANFKSLHNAIEPSAYYIPVPGEYRGELPRAYSYIKITGNDVKGTIDHVRNTLRTIDPAFPARINFLDQSMENLYRQSLNQGLMITLFSLLAVLLSIIGVFGLVVFEAQGRRKEIAIRKVLGSTVRQILVMLNTGFVKIVLVCFVIAAPLAWYGVKMWLGNFAYQTPIHFWIFGLAFVLVLMLTVLTVTFQSYRTAIENPVKAIKAS